MSGEEYYDDDDFEVEDAVARPEKKVVRSKIRKEQVAIENDQEIKRLLERKRQAQARAKSRMKELHKAYDRRIMRKVRRFERLAAKLKRGSPYVTGGSLQRNSTKKGSSNKKKASAKEILSRKTKSQKTSRALHDASIVAERFDIARNELKRISVNAIVALSKTRSSQGQPHLRTVTSIHLRVLRTIVYLLLQRKDSAEATTESDLSWQECCRILQRPSTIDVLMKIKPSTMHTSALERLTYLGGSSSTERSRLSFRSIAQSRISPRLIRIFAKWLGALQEAAVMTFVLRSLQRAKEGVESPSAGSAPVDREKLKLPRANDKSLSRSKQKHRIRVPIWQWHRRIEEERSNDASSNGEHSQNKARDLRKKLRDHLLSKNSQLLLHMDACPQDADISLGEFSEALEKSLSAETSPHVTAALYRDVKNGSPCGSFTWGSFQGSLFPELNHA